MKTNICMVIKIHKESFHKHNLSEFSKYPLEEC